MRIMLPNRVLRGSLLVLQAESSAAFTRMERNLYIIKGRLFSPTRSCLKMIGPGLDSLTPMATPSMMGLVSTISTRLPTTSMARLIKAFRILSNGVCRMLMSLQSPSTSMVGRAGR